MDCELIYIQHLNLCHWFFYPEKGASSTSITKQRNQQHVYLWSPVHIFAPLRFLRFSGGLRLGLSCPLFLSAGWIEEKLLVFHSSFPWSACWGRRNIWGRSGKLQLHPLFWEREGEKLSKAAVIRLKDEHKSLWGEHSGRINCWEGVSRGGCENFCNMKRLYLQSLQKLWSWPPSLSHTHI